MKLHIPLLLTLLLATQPAYAMDMQDDTDAPRLTQQEINQLTKDVHTNLKNLRLSRLIILRKELFEQCFDQKYHDSLPTLTESDNPAKVYDPIKEQILWLALISKQKIKTERKKAELPHDQKKLDQPLLHQKNHKQ